MKTAKQSSRSSGSSSVKGRKDRQERPSPVGSEVQIADTFSLSVRDVNNLVRFLYTNGWISRESHPDVHILLDEMITWLERQGIKVDMDMKRME